VSNATQLIANGLEPIASHVALTGPDITLAAILRPFVLTGAQLQLVKYLKTPNYTGQNPYLDRMATWTVSSEGTFVKGLAKEMEAMHGPEDMRYGMSLPRDNIEQCLWGAMKGMLGTVAQAIQPAASAAASIGCVPVGGVPLLGQFLKPACVSMAKNLINYAADSSRVSTNRVQHTPVSVALDGMDKMIKEAKREERTMLSEERRPVKPVKPLVNKGQKKNKSSGVKSAKKAGKGKMKKK